MLTIHYYNLQILCISLHFNCAYVHICNKTMKLQLTYISEEADGNGGGQGWAVRVSEEPEEYGRLPAGRFLASCLVAAGQTHFLVKMSSAHPYLGQ